jgi:hypothetical protein
MTYDPCQDDLPGYVSGRLEGEDRRRIEAHLEECGDCRAIADTWKRLASGIHEGGVAMLEAHPAEMELRDHALGFAHGAQGRIERHIEMCAICALDVEAWRSRAASAAAKRSPRDGRKRVTIVASVSAAAGLILGAGLATLLKRAPTEPPAGEPVYHLVLPSSTVRGNGPSIDYRMTSGQRRVEVDFRPVIPRDSGDDECCRFEIRREGSGTIWSAVLPAARARERLASDQVIGFDLPAVLLVPGRYRFIVLPPGGGDDAAAQSVSVEILPPF